MIHIRILKHKLNHGLVFENVDRVIKFNQNVWLKLYIDINTDLRKKAKNDFERDFFKLMNNTVLEGLWKMWENIEMLNLSQQKEKQTIWC